MCRRERDQTRMARSCTGKEWFGCDGGRGQDEFLMCLLALLYMYILLYIHSYIYMYPATSTRMDLPSKRAKAHLI